MVSIDHAEWVSCKGGLKSFKRYNEMISHYLEWENQSRADDRRDGLPVESRRQLLTDYFEILWSHGLDAHSEEENGTTEELNIEEVETNVKITGRKVTTLWSLYSVLNSYFLCTVKIPFRSPLNFCLVRHMIIAIIQYKLVMTYDDKLYTIKYTVYPNQSYLKQ